MPLTEYAIEVNSLNKTFTIREKSKRSIKDSVLKFYQRKGDIRKIKALKDINFKVKKGEFFGIIGRNGSGKSTLLRLIMGSYKPDKGSKIISNGKMIRLAMGLGFDMNLSARDNIYVNASILGISFKKIGSIFQEIISFAEIEDFIDTPIKHYSSGMVAKLKFSIAKYAVADILLMDEIFGGVGDISFQYKSQKVFKEKLISGKTIILVSHNLQIISEHCTRVLLIDNGEQVAIGSPEEVIPIYENLFKDVIMEQKFERKQLALERQKQRLIVREKLVLERKKIIEAQRKEAKLIRQKIMEGRKLHIEEKREKAKEEQILQKQRWRHKLNNIRAEKNRVLIEYKKLKKELNLIKKENEKLKSIIK